MTLDYHVVLLSFNQSIDAATQSLYELGSVGVVPDGPQGLRAYFNSDVPCANIVDRLEKFFGEPAIRSAHTIALNEQTTIPTFKPFLLAQNWRVIPPADSISSSQDVIIQPGPAFGSGQHITTRLAAELILTVAKPNLSFLDVGTGSGLLAILAAKLKLAPISAAEIDAAARQNAADNFRLNSCPAIELMANIEAISGKFDIVVANVLAPTLVFLKSQLNSHLKPNGLLILSGMTTSEEALIEENFSNLQLLSRLQNQEWVAHIRQHVSSN